MSEDRTHGGQQPAYLGDTAATVQATDIDNVSTSLLSTSMIATLDGLQEDEYHRVPHTHAMDGRWAYSLEGGYLPFWKLERGPTPVGIRFYWSGGF